MLNILTGQCFEGKNFITRRNNISNNKVQEAVIEISNKFKEYSLIKDKYIVTTTRSIEIIPNGQMLDIEILFPVKEKIKVKKPYIFKEKIKIENALYTKIEQDMNELNHVLQSMNKYMMDYKLQPVTSAYIMQYEHSIEIYIGLSPNIL